MKKILAVLLCLTAFTSAAHAVESVPGQERDALNKACMGGKTSQEDPERAEYCDCMRESLSSWTDEDFKEAAAQAAKAKNAGQESPKLQELAKACITKVLGTMPQ